MADSIAVVGAGRGQKREAQSRWKKGKAGAMMAAGFTQSWPPTSSAGGLNSRRAQACGSEFLA